MNSSSIPKTAISEDKSRTLNRLLTLRTIALSGLAIYALLFSHFSTSGLIIGFLLISSAIYSISIWLYYAKTQKPITNGVLVTQLLWDGIVILCLVYISGRSSNPFIYYLLVIIAISASIFREKTVWMFCSSGIFAYTTLMYLDANQHMAHMNSDFRSHLFGMWINFVGSAILISFFISRLTATLRNRERALAQAREEVLKNEQLIGIGTLAASTVHSFGTPLSTIAMATGEIESLHKDSDTLECTAMIKTQIERCKNTMKKLTSLANHKESPYQDIMLELFVAELEEHFILMNSDPLPNFNLNNAKLNSFLPGGVLLLHAIINLIDNAIQAAKTQVNITVNSAQSSADIIIEDDGDGLKPALLESLGDVVSSSKTGLGIGFLLANSTIERLGGSVRFSNTADINGSSLTRVIVFIPLENPTETVNINNKQ